MSVYPALLDYLDTDKTDVTPSPGDHPAHHNALASAVNAVESELGLNPAGGSNSVAERLTAVDSAIAAATVVTKTGQRPTELTGNGVRVLFTVPDDYVPDTLVVTLNGLEEAVAQNPPNQFTFAQAPLVGDIIYLRYNVA